MGLIDEITEVIIAVFLVIVFFFNVLPEVAKATGFSVFLIYLLGIILLAAIILPIFRRL